MILEWGSVDEFADGGSTINPTNVMSTGTLGAKGVCGRRCGRVPRR